MEKNNCEIMLFGGVVQRWTASTWTMPKQAGENCGQAGDHCHIHASLVSQHWQLVVPKYSGITSVSVHEGIQVTNCVIQVTFGINSKLSYLVPHPCSQPTHVFRCAKQALCIISSFCNIHTFFLFVKSVLEMFLRLPKLMFCPNVLVTWSLW